MILGKSERVGRDETDSPVTCGKSESFESKEPVTHSLVTGSSSLEIPLLQRRALAEGRE